MWRIALNVFAVSGLCAIFSIPFFYHPSSAEKQRLLDEKKEIETEKIEIARLRRLPLEERPPDLDDRAAELKLRIDGYNFETRTFLRRNRNDTDVRLVGDVSKP